MEMTVIRIVIGALGKSLKELEALEIREQEETIQITASLRTVRILRRIPET